MLNLVVAWDENGNIARTFNYLSLSPTWEDIKEDMLGAVNDADYNWQSAYIMSGYKTGSLGMFVVTTDGTDLRVYYSNDVRADPVVWTLQETYTMNDDSVTSEARIAASKTEAGLVVVAWKDQTGTQLAQTTDGESWGGEFYVGSVISDSVTNDNKPIGLAVDGVKRLVTAPDEQGHYFLYMSTTLMNAFDKVAGSKVSTEPFPTVTVDNEGRAYIGMVDELYCVEYPFTSASYEEDWTVESGFNGHYISGEGWAPSCWDPGSGPGCFLRISCLGTGSINITHWEVRINVTDVLPNDLAITIKRGLAIDTLTPSAPGIYELDGDDPAPVGSFAVEIISLAGESGAVLEYVKLEGKGSSYPSHGENCLE